MIYKKIESPKCNLCKNATLDKSPLNVICKFRGTVPCDFACKKFDYDIFKREIKPRPKQDFSKFSKKDFEI